MPELNDLAALVRSRIPIIVIESREEFRITEMLKQISSSLSMRFFKWSYTDGMSLVSGGTESTEGVVEPTEVLRRIWSVKTPGVYLLYDFHPYLSDPRNVRLLKDIGQGAQADRQNLVLLSYQIEIPEEIKHLAARFEVSLPDETALTTIVNDVIKGLSVDYPRTSIKIDPTAVKLLVKNLNGLSAPEAEQIAKKAIRNQAITVESLPDVEKAKYELLNRGGVIYFEHDTKQFSDIGGFKLLKKWLDQRRGVFIGEQKLPNEDLPKGILLLGVQGGGKSLAAKTVAGSWGVPLLRLDFGALYDKYYGETERKTRESLKMAEMMAPCVLWLDELEKGVATGEGDGGVSRRVLGTLLTWMSERKSAVFIAATANDIQALPPELMRKGRFDEIFFVDLPDADVRKEIFAIHLKRRGLSPEGFNLDVLAAASEGFSGAEIEQAIVSGFYSMSGGSGNLTMSILLDQLKTTRPLSVVMSEQVESVREWAKDRTVHVN